MNCEMELYEAALRSRVEVVDFQVSRVVDCWVEFFGEDARGFIKEDSSRIAALRSNLRRFGLWEILGMLEFSAGREKDHVAAWDCFGRIVAAVAVTRDQGRLKQAWFVPDLSPVDRLVLLFIEDCWRPFLERLRASARLIGDMCGCSEESVLLSLERLRERGLIGWTKAGEENAIDLRYPDIQPVGEPIYPTSNFCGKN